MKGGVKTYGGIRLILAIILILTAVLASLVFSPDAGAAPPAQAQGNCFGTVDRVIRTTAMDGMTISFSPGVEYRIVTVHNGWTMLVNDVHRTAWVLSSRVTITRCDPIPGVHSTPQPARQPRRCFLLFCW